ncbi:hypothetical protein PKOR_18290 [Pontibacter korlensis]|uniref:Uncharacterized protein n=1 Tax=Pontibacter korlensis TaxID=400092 RepID=A0A0E3ZHA0_9BACT|nr:hypothetical protein PKOR_18290 [Pontibacter korlensis]
MPQAKGNAFYLLLIEMQRFCLRLYKLPENELHKFVGHNREGNTAVADAENRAGIFMKGTLSGRIGRVHYQHMLMLPHNFVCTWLPGRPGKQQGHKQCE